MTRNEQSHLYDDDGVGSDDDDDAHLYPSCDV